MKGKYVFRGLVYVLGLIVLALGVTMNTKTGLGVAPIVSVAYGAGAIFDWSFANAALVYYVLLAVAEYFIKGKNFRLYDLLQIPLSYVFTRFIAVFGAILPMWQSVWGKCLGIVIAIICTGVGACMVVNMRLVPNPGDGIVQAISDRCHRRIGTCKNIFDISSVAVTCLLTLLTLRRVEGVGIGTLCAMLGVGRVMAIFNRLFFKKLNTLCGVMPPAGSADNT